MDADISAQDRFYRRGLVLGFTLAEIMVLIIFALLLAISWHLVAKDKEIDKLKQSLTEKEAVVAKLTERTRTLEERVARGDDFDDLFRELEQAKEQQAAKEQANVALREKLEALEQLEKVKEGMKAAGLDDSQVKEFVENTLGKLAETERRADRLEGQLRNLQRKLGGLGKGTEMPACWASQETEKPEYIFNTALTSNGIIVRDNALPHRAAQQAQLPLQAMVFEKELPPNRFRAMSRAVFEWSKKKGCRFFVRVYDLTKDKEKLIYKRHLRTVGDHFYIYEVLDSTFRTADDRS